MRVKPKCTGRSLPKRRCFWPQVLASSWDHVFTLRPVGRDSPRGGVPSHTQRWCVSGMPMEASAVLLRPRIWASNMRQGVDRAPFWVTAPRAPWDWVVSVRRSEDVAAAHLATPSCSNVPCSLCPLDSFLGGGRDSVRVLSICGQYRIRVQDR